MATVTSSKRQQTHTSDTYESNSSVTIGSDIVIGDLGKIKLGGSADLQIYHDGTNSYIDNASTYLILESDNIILRNNAGTEDYAKFLGNGAVNLYHNNSSKLCTTSTGVNVGGNITLTGTVDGRDVAADGAKLNGIACGATSCTGDITAVTAGSGLTGGATSGAATLNVGAGTAITVAADTVGVTTACNTAWNNKTTCTGTITCVAAGTGLTGGGASGCATVNVIGGSGITANANDIAVDSTVVRTSGAQTIADIKTFSGSAVRINGRLCVNGIGAICTPGGNFTGSIYFGSGGTCSAYTSGNNGRFNTGVGNGALFSSTTSSGNFAGGYDALKDTTSGCFNVGVGYKSLCKNTTGCLNVAVGYETLKCNVSGKYNTAIGAYNLFNNVDGDGNTAVGYKSLCTNTGGDNSTAVGYQSMRFNSTGARNTAMGYQAGMYNSTGNDNTVIGQQALYSNCTGCYNTATGRNALYCSTANSNSGFGYTALYHNAGGAQNVGVGYAAGRFIANGSTQNTTPNQGIFIGTNSKASCASTTNEIVIGYNAIGCGSNTVKIGNTSTTVVCSNGTFSTVSDKRDKTCICDIEHGLSFISDLKPKTYNMITDRTNPEGSISCKRHGFIAQDVIALEGDDNIIISNDNPDQLGYTGEHIIPILVKGMQEQQELINDLTARLETLEG